jgi:hypothetical protein
MKFVSAALAGAAASNIHPLQTVLNIPTVTIAPTVEMPMQGLGTWLYSE